MVRCGYHSHAERKFSALHHSQGSPQDLLKA